MISVIYAVYRDKEVALGYLTDPLFAKNWVDSGNDELSTFSKEYARIRKEYTVDNKLRFLKFTNHWAFFMSEGQKPKYPEVRNWTISPTCDQFRGYKLVELQELKTDGL